MKTKSHNSRWTNLLIHGGLGVISIIHLHFHTEGRKHVFTGVYGILLFADDEVYVAPLIKSITWLTMSTYWNAILHHNILSIVRHGHIGGAAV